MMYKKYLTHSDILCQSSSNPNESLPSLLQDIHTQIKEHKAQQTHDKFRHIPYIITLIGAGGKSSLMKCLGLHFSALGYKTLLTTTTHIFKPDYIPSGFCFETENLSQLKHFFSMQNLAAVGIPVAQGSPTEHKSVTDKPSSDLSSSLPKWKAPSPSFLEELCGLPIDLIICEGDGSKCLPIKAPRVHEPVFYPNTHLVLGVVGLSALSKPVAEVMFGYSDYVARLRLSASAPVTFDLIYHLATSPHGLQKAIGGKKFRLILNQADLLTDSQYEQSQQFLEELFSQEQIIGYTLALGDPKA